MRWLWALLLLCSCTRALTGNVLYVDGGLHILS